MRCSLLRRTREQRALEVSLSCLVARHVHDVVRSEPGERAVLGELNSLHDLPLTIDHVVREPIPRVRRRCREYPQTPVQIGEDRSLLNRRPELRELAVGHDGDVELDLRRTWWHLRHLPLELIVDLSLIHISEPTRLLS